MAKGSEIVNFRVEADLLAEMQRAVAAHNYHTRDGVIGMSEWIRKAIRAKLDQNKRAKKSKVHRREQRKLEQAVMS